MTAKEARRKVEENIEFLKKEKLQLKDLEDAQQVAKAESVMAMFDQKLAEAVANNKFLFNLQRLTYCTDYNSGPPYNELSLQRCKPWVRLVFNQISKKEGFKAALVHDHDGCGMDEWFDIIVSY